jgi:signal transduction histidine kinase
MKYWQKTFLATLILFLAALNFGAYFLNKTALITSLDSERERSFAEHGFICGSLNDDIAAILSREETPSDTMWDSLFRRYAEYYYSQNISIAVEDADGRTYTAMPAIAEAPDAKDDGSKASVIKSVDGTPYLFVSGRIGDSDFTLITARSVAAMQSRTDNLSRTLAFASAVMSAALALALYFILKRLTLPIKKLSDAATAISDGDYSCRIVMHGRDEIAELASRFYTMAEKVQAHISELTMEAERKQRFIDDLAHEMRTPLAAIGGYAQYLSGAAITDEERFSAFEYISRESGRLADLAEKLLMLTKLRHESPECERAELQELFSDLEKAVCTQSHHIRFKANGTVWYTDKTLIYMLLLNLVQNAVHACGSIGDISVVADDEKIVVSDNGCGISKESLALITEPFYRVDKSRSRKDGGAGLGLSICKGICECLGLDMRIESKEGKGTTVTVLQVHNNSQTNC